MKLLEHEAKKLLTSSGVTVPKSQMITSPEEDILSILPTVLKSQVLTGRRNKHGGIKIAKTQSELEQYLPQVFMADIEGHMATSVLAEELLDIDREIYLNLTVSRDEQAIVLLAHKDGGVDIESQPVDAFYREVIDRQSLEVTALRLAEYLGLEEQEFALSELLKNLLDCMEHNDALLIEINPLVVTKDGRLVSADCKMELDDAASFRHSGWDFYDKPSNANFVELNPHGTVATIANGAGLAMATVDAVQAAGYAPANFLDVGGGANKESVLASFREIVKYPALEAIVINIFAGITRCDEVARAILAARNEIDDLPSLYIRLEGTNVDEARKILNESSLTLYPSLEAAISSIGVENE